MLQTQVYVSVTPPVEVIAASFSSRHNVFQYLPPDKVIRRKVNFLFLNHFELHYKWMISSWCLLWQKMTDQWVRQRWFGAWNCRKDLWSSADFPEWKQYESPQGVRTMVAGADDGVLNLWRWVVPRHSSWTTRGTNKRRKQPPEIEVYNNPDSDSCNWECAAQVRNSYSSEDYKHASIVLLN